MQTRTQSGLEVGIDFGLSFLMNIGAQILFYGALATAGRSLLVAALVLGLALPRRYTTRRTFNALQPHAAGQSCWHSWAEVGVDTVLGLGMAIVVQWIFYGPAATWATAGGLTAVVYAITMCRRYILRRCFERWSMRQQTRASDARHSGGRSAVAGLRRGSALDQPQQEDAALIESQ
jgi:hypothetical protein